MNLKKSIGTTEDQIEAEKNRYARKIQDKITSESEITVFREYGNGPRYNLQTGGSYVAQVIMDDGQVINAQGSSELSALKRLYKRVKRFTRE